MRIGADRVKVVNAQKLLKEFENIQFKEGESVDDFGMRITNLVGNLKTLGETNDDVRVVKKFLHVVPPQFTQVVVSIEMFCNLKELTVEELIGRLRAAEERFDDKVEQIVDKAGRLLLAEDDWLEKNKHRFHSSHKQGGGKTGAGTSKRCCSGAGQVDLHGHAEAKRPVSQLWHLWPLGRGLQTPTDEGEEG